MHSQHRRLARPCGTFNAYGTAALDDRHGARGAARQAGAWSSAWSDRDAEVRREGILSIPPGALAVSDPVNLAVPKLGDWPSVSTSPRIPAP